MRASGRIDAKLTAANPIDVEARAGIGNVWSPETLRRWLAQKLGKSDVATMKQYVDLLPHYLVRRFLSGDQMAEIVSGRLPIRTRPSCYRPSIGWRKP